ncbi:MAG: YaiO family outer membrane beta-barrel protein [Acidobacteria bacterium]|nr:YaiO family outer membrane beta-barrel protein [Acidobacteriota bacterium]
MNGHPFTALMPCILILPTLAAQAPEGVDEMYFRARRLGSEGHREKARTLCREALKRSPDYHDIRILLGRLFAWDDRYDEGRVELQEVLRRKPEHLDGREALVDLELWSDHPRQALTLCTEGLVLHPQAAGLHFRRARALKTLGDYPAALESASRAVVTDPNLHAARRLRDDLAELNQRSQVGITATYDHFDRTFDPWRSLALSAGHRFDFGSVIGRVTQASRFGETGTQVEVDSYPRLGEGTYAYLNAGYSSAAIFPTFRWGAELYHNFPKGIEASLGVRHLRFSSTAVSIYTGSFGKYWGDWLFTLRANTTPSSVGASRSGSLSARRYFGDAETYLGLSLGTGVSPDQANPSAEILDLRSRKASLAGQARVGRRLILSSGIAWERQEVNATLTRTEITISAGLDVKF